MAKTEVKPEAAPEVEAVCVPCLESLRAERDAHLKSLISRQSRGHIESPLTSADGFHRQTAEMAHQTALAELLMATMNRKRKWS